MNFSIGQKIKELRKDRGLNQTQMAAMLGVHLQTLSRYERGELTPGPDILSVLAEKFGLDANELLLGEKMAVREELAEYGAKLDPLSREVLEMFAGMDPETRHDVLKYAEKMKKLAELLRAYNRRK